MGRMFRPGPDGNWYHPGWLAVPPGQSAKDPTVNEVTTPRALRIVSVDLTGSGAVPGGGTTGGGGTVASGATYFGAEPNPAGNGTANQQSLINKWGGRPASRQYFGTGGGTPVHQAGISIVQWSWSWGSLDAEVNAGTHDAYFASCAAAMKNGDIASYAHESNNKGLAGAALTARINAMNRFYDVFKNTKPGVLIAPTHTGYMFSPKNGGGAADRVTWGAVKGDLIGADLDGVHIDTKNADGSFQFPGATDYSPYIDYLPHITNIKNFITANKARGYTGWCVPEIMTSRYTPIDPSGTKRAAWFDKNLTYVKDNDAYSCHIWDFPRPSGLGGESTTAFNVIPNPSPEMTVIKSFIATNPANPA